MIDYMKYCELVDQLNQWTAEYESGDGAPADAVYDGLYKQIKQFEKMNPAMILKDSPTMKVGSTSKSTDGFVKVEHEQKMQSIANINSDAELRNWLRDKVEKGISVFILEYKIDGMSLALKYEESELDDSITRGDGDVGDRVLANAMQIESIMKTIPGYDKAEIRGEIVWHNDHFVAYNDELIALGKKPMSNPRNGVAGTMKQLDPSEVGRRKLNFVAYRFLSGSPHTNHSDDLDTLNALGFTTSPYWRFTVDGTPESIEAVVTKVAEMNVERKKLPYITDGLVIKVNDKTAYAALGGTSKCPHAFGAYKFPAEVKSTGLKCVDSSSGKTGAVTPVANVETVELSLTKVSRASLHNWDMMEFMGVYEGCKVNIRKAGEIIPEIISVVGFEHRGKDVYEAIRKKTKISVIESIMAEVGVDINVIEEFVAFLSSFSLDGRVRDSAIVGSIAELHRASDLPFIKRPTTCKHCGATLKNDVNVDGEDLIALICPNQKCPSLQMKLMEAFVSKECMNIMNVGESTVTALIDAGLLKSFSDFYDLSLEMLKSTEFSERESERIIEGINASRTAYLHQLLNAFGIDGVGRSASAALSEHFDSLIAIRDAVITNPNEIRSVDKVGDVSGDSLIAWFTENKDLVNYFIANNIGCQAKKKVVKGSSLSGLMMIMTGKSSKVGRDEFVTIVVEQGGKVSKSITGKVDCVLLGDGAGPKKIQDIKTLQAQGSKIKVITDDEFLAMIGR